MSSLNENGTITLQNIFEMVGPMNAVLQQSLRNLDIFKEIAFAEFENLRKEIRSAQEKDEFLVPEIPPEKGRTKGKITASNISQITSTENTPQIVPEADNTTVLRKSNLPSNPTRILKDESDESTVQDDTSADQTTILRRSNRTLVKNSQNISKHPFNEDPLQTDPVSDQTVTLRRSNRTLVKELTTRGTNSNTEQYKYCPQKVEKDWEDMYIFSGYERSDRNSQNIPKHPLNKETLQTDPMSDQTMTLRRSNRTLAKNSQNVSKHQLNEETLQISPESDQTMVLRRSSRQAALKLKSQMYEFPNKSTCEHSEKLPEVKVRSSKAPRNEKSKLLSINVICSPLEVPRASRVRNVNKQQKPVAEVVQTIKISQDDKIVENTFANKNRIIQDNESKSNKNSNKENAEQANEIENNNQTEGMGGYLCDIKPKDNCDVTQSTVQFHGDHFSTSTPRSFCLLGKSKEDVVEEIEMVNKEQNLLLPVGDKNTLTHIDVNDGVTKKMVNKKEVEVLKDNTNTVTNSKVLALKSQFRNSKIANKENSGYNTPERLHICRVVSGSVKEKVEAFEKASKNGECSSRIQSTVKTLDANDTEKKFEYPMRITRNMSKALQNALNNKGPALKEFSNLKTIQEKSNVVKNQEQKDKVYKRKEEIMKAALKEKQRKREEMGKKVLAQREAVEKAKLELALKLEKEKDEKFKKVQKEREERIKKLNAKKKLLAAQKAIEMEERRKEEEAARMARLKETGEQERRKVVPMYQLEQGKIYMQKMMEIRKEKERIKAVELNQNEQKSKEKDKNPEEYRNNNINAEDSSDDDIRRKYKVPKWALSMNYGGEIIQTRDKNRKQALLEQSHVPEIFVQKWLHKKNDKIPDLETLFSSGILSKQRTSSILWDSRVCFDNSAAVF